MDGHNNTIKGLNEQMLSSESWRVCCARTKGREKKRKEGEVIGVNLV